MRDGSVDADGVEADRGGDDPEGGRGQCSDNGRSLFGGDVLVQPGTWAFADEGCGKWKAHCKGEQAEDEVGGAPSQMCDDRLNEYGKEHGSQSGAGKHD